MENLTKLFELNGFKHAITLLKDNGYTIDSDYDDGILAIKDGVKYIAIPVLLKNNEDKLKLSEATISMYSNNKKKIIDKGYKALICLMIPSVNDSAQEGYIHLL